jgi:hypothetical protein
MDGSVSELYPDDHQSLPLCIHPCMLTCCLLLLVLDASFLDLPLVVVPPPVLYSLASLSSEFPVLPLPMKAATTICSSSPTTRSYPNGATRPEEERRPSSLEGARGPASVQGKEGGSSVGLGGESKGGRAGECRVEGAAQHATGQSGQFLSCSRPAWRGSGSGRWPCKTEGYQ